MVTYKNITIKKKGGGTRKQRVKVLKSGKFKFVKNLKGKIRRPKSRTSNPKKGGKRKMPKKKGRRRGKSLQQMMFKFLRAGALAAPAIYTALEHEGDLKETVEHGLYRYTGFSMRRGKFELQGLTEGWGPYVGSVLTTYGIPKLVSFIRRL